MNQSEFEAFLDDFSACFLSEDLDLWMARVRIPLCLILPSGSQVIKTVGEMRCFFNNCITAKRIQRIDAIVRRPLELEVCEDGVLLATYETHLLRSGHRLVDPFQSTAMLRRSEYGLVAGSILNSIDLDQGSRSHEWSGYSNKGACPLESSSFGGWQGVVH